MTFSQANDVSKGENIAPTQISTNTESTRVILPPPAATPNEIRQFLVTLLVSTRHLEIAVARRIANQWTLGTGQDLRSYPFQLFREIFAGEEEAWVIFKEVRLLMSSEEKIQVDRSTVQFCCNRGPRQDLARLLKAIISFLVTLATICYITDTLSMYKHIVSTGVTFTALVVILLLPTPRIQVQETIEEEEAWLEHQMRKEFK